MQPDAFWVQTSGAIAFMRSKAWDTLYGDDAHLTARSGGRLRFEP